MHGALSTFGAVGLVLVLAGCQALTAGQRREGAVARGDTTRTAPQQSIDPSPGSGADSWTAYLPATAGQACTLAAPDGSSPYSLTLRNVEKAAEVTYYDFEQEDDSGLGSFGYSVPADGSLRQSSGGKLGDFDVFSSGPDLPPPSELRPGGPIVVRDMVIAVEEGADKLKEFRLKVSIVPSEPRAVVLDGTVIAGAVTFGLLTVSSETTKDTSAGSFVLEGFTADKVDPYRDLTEYTYAPGMGLVGQETLEGEQKGARSLVKSCSA